MIFCSKFNVLTWNFSKVLQGLQLLSLPKEHGKGPVMPKSRNLPMTTREPISHAKAREFLITKLELGLPPNTDSAAIGRSLEFWVTLLI